MKARELAATKLGAKRPGPCRLLAAALVTLVGAACEGGSNRSPTAPALPTPASSPAPVPTQSPGPQGVQSWLLDWWLTSVTGTEECVVREWRSGAAFTGAAREPLTVEFSDGSIRFIYLPDGTNYTGPLRGHEFDAGSPGWSGLHVCQDGTTHPFEIEIRLTGRFSDDWRSLAAAEVWRHRFEGGGSVDLRYDWSAVLSP